VSSFMEYNKVDYLHDMYEAVNEMTIRLYKAFGSGAGPVELSVSPQLYRFLKDELVQKQMRFYSKDFPLSREPQIIQVQTCCGHVLIKELKEESCT